MSEIYSHPEQQQAHPENEYYLRLIKPRSTSVADLSLYVRNAQEGVMQTQFGSIHARAITTSDAETSMELTVGTFYKNYEDSLTQESNSPNFFFRNGDIIISLTAHDDSGAAYHDRLVIDRGGSSAYYITREPEIMNLSDDQMLDRYATVMCTTRELIRKPSSEAKRQERASWLGRIATKFKRK